MRFIAALVINGAIAAAEVKLGQPLKLKESMPIANLIARPDPFVGKTVQVKGKVTEVCQMMGCWMALTDTATHESIRIQVKDGEMVFPKDSAGKIAVAEGKLEKLSLTQEQTSAQARHEAEEQGRKFNPDAVKGPSVSYQIRGTGAVLVDSAQ